MSDVGKRTIWVGPADGANSKPLNIEGTALDADTLPGSLVEVVATGIQSQTVLPTVFGQMLLIADKDQQRTRSVDDVWTLADNMVAIQPRSGEFMNALVVAASDITEIGTALTRSAASPEQLAIALTDGTQEILCYADEIINTTGGAATGTLVRVRVA